MRNGLLGMSLAAALAGSAAAQSIGGFAGQGLNAGSSVVDAEESGIRRKCPNFDIYCLDVWDPVTCSNGVTYSNLCYATYYGCATGCVPGNPAAIFGSDVDSSIFDNVDVDLDASAGALDQEESAEPVDGGPPFRPCPRRGVYCLDVWDPVICDNGQVYSNLCYATNFYCATGCVPWGGDVMLNAGDGSADAEAESQSFSYEPGDTVVTDEEILSGAGPRWRPCPRFDVYCLDVYDPVQCSDGNTYPNLCYATYYGCATGCGPVTW